MNLTRTRNAMIGSLVVAVARRSLQRRFGGRPPVWPFFLFGVIGVFTLVVWRRRRSQPDATVAAAEG
ncbi:MAG: hypothetical protein ACR2OD_11690 [Gaiellaceae bacterium]